MAEKETGMFALVKNVLKQEHKITNFKYLDYPIIIPHCVPMVHLVAVQIPFILIF